MSDSLQNWSDSLKVVQGGFLVAILFYIVVFSGGGFFTAYYAWMLAIVSGMIAAVVSMTQKNAVMVLIDMALIALMFIHFIQMA